MNQESDRAGRVPGVTTASGVMTASGSLTGSSARPVKSGELDPAERRRKDAETAGIDETCIELLCARYRGRGIAGKARADAEKQQKREARTRSLNPDAYCETERPSDDRRCMTADDYRSYFESRRGFGIPEYVPGAAVRRSRAEAAVQAPTVPKAGWLTDADKLPARLKKYMEKPLFRLLDQWAGETFPRETEMIRADRKPHRIPAGAAAGLAVIAVSMSLVISGTVLVSRSTREVSELKDTLAEKQAVRSELSDRLDLKNDLLGIMDVAANELGMVGEEYVNGQYLDSRAEDRLEVYGDGGADTDASGWAAILSAFGLSRE